MSLARSDIHACSAGGSIASAGHPVDCAVVEACLEGRIYVDSAGDGQGRRAEGRYRTSSRPGDRRDGLLDAGNSVISGRRAATLYDSLMVIALVRGDGTGELSSRAAVS